MRNQCDGCGENTIDCICNDESLTCISDFPIELVELFNKSFSRSLSEVNILIENSKMQD